MIHTKLCTVIRLLTPASNVRRISECAKLAQNPFAGGRSSHTRNMRFLDFLVHFFSLPCCQINRWSRSMAQTIHYSSKKSLLGSNQLWILLRTSSKVLTLFAFDNHPNRKGQVIFERREIDETSQRPTFTNGVTKQWALHFPSRALSSPRNSQYAVMDDEKITF